MELKCYVTIQRELKCYIDYKIGTDMFNVTIKKELKC